ncbi:hypothetical protein [Scatolibacter rhodanostii]|uniref:hypothetical protein n=1 Tax=Scatolibacter rhodanostii TaxID=2014781 RepID=UPI000C08B464|nr:hypothetical protein [Scatolibacter rhodanostii]
MKSKLCFLKIIIPLLVITLSVVCWNHALTDIRYIYCNGDIYEVVSPLDSYQKIEYRDVKADETFIVDSSTIKSDSQFYTYKAEIKKRKTYYLTVFDEQGALKLSDDFYVDFVLLGSDFTWAKSPDKNTLSGFEYISVLITHLRLNEIHDNLNSYRNIFIVCEIIGYIIILGVGHFLWQHHKQKKWKMALCIFIGAIFILFGYSVLNAI